MPTSKKPVDNAIEHATDYLSPRDWLPPGKGVKRSGLAAVRYAEAEAAAAAAADPPGGGGGSGGSVADGHPVPLQPPPRGTTKRPQEKIQLPELEASNPFLLLVQRYHDDPVGFVREVLGAEPLPWQTAFLNSLAAGERRISVRAGHGVGKSTACAWAMIWHMVTRYPQKTVCTAPTAGQLYDALFSEVKHWIQRLPEYCKSLIEIFSDRITLRSSPESSFISARTSSADRPEALAGIHSEHVLLICDEASAIPEPVFESAAGSMSGHSAATVLIGNPTRNSGLFFRTHHGLSDTWKTMHVSCVDNRLVNEDFVQQIKATYGEESNAFRVRVLGEFALRDDDVLIPADLVDAAMERDVVLIESDPIVYGLDVARFGDDRSVLCKRQGNVVLDFKTWRGLDLMQLVGAVVSEARGDRPAEIVVDSIGLGAGVADRLRELQGEVPDLKNTSVRDVNVSESAAMNPQANRLRDDLWLSARDFLRTRACRLPRDPDLRQELVSPTYKFTSTGKIQVEGKDSLKKRGLKSPDLADSLCLTFASSAASVGGRAPRWIAGQALKRNIRGIV
jgi:phage terminase large subunit